MTSRTSATKRSQTGRPPKIKLADIVNAALKIGLERATIRNVASKLRVSVTGLYHHVRTQEELIDLVVQSTFERAMENTPEAATFEEHLLVYARRLFDLYVAYPQGIRTFYSGVVLFTPHSAPIHEKLVAHALQEGLTPAETFDIWTSTMAAVLGAAAMGAAERATRHGEDLLLLQINRVTRQDQPDLPALQRVAEACPTKSDHFQKVRVMVEGLRALYGDKMRRPITPT